MTTCVDERVFVGLGSNLGNRLNYLQQALDLLVQAAGKVIQTSSVFETAPWRMEVEEHFLNAVVEVRSRLSVNDMMEALIQIEHAMGRERSSEHTGYQSRVIDLDLLYIGNQIVKTKMVEVPHPRLHLRKFVLEPLAEIAPEFVDPLRGEPISKLNDQLTDEVFWLKKLPDAKLIL